MYTRTGDRDARRPRVLSIQLNTTLQPVCLFVQFVCLFVCLLACLFVCLFVCLLTYKPQPKSLTYTLHIMSCPSSFPSWMFINDTHLMPILCSSFSSWMFIMMYILCSSYVHLMFFLCSPFALWMFIMMFILCSSYVHLFPLGCSS